MKQMTRRLMQDLVSWIDVKIGELLGAQRVE